MNITPRVELTVFDKDKLLLNVRYPVARSRVRNGFELESLIIKEPLVSRTANRLRMSEAINIRNPSGIIDLAGHTYSRTFSYTTLGGSVIMTFWLYIDVLSKASNTKLHSFVFIPCILLDFLKEAIPRLLVDLFVITEFPKIDCDNLNNFLVVIIR